MTPRRYVITGSASGIGAATKELLEEQGARVIGVDRHDAEVVADLSSEAGRELMVREVAAICGGSLNGVISVAGVGGGQGPAIPVIRVNYFGARATLVGLRPLLAKGAEPCAVVVGSVGMLRARADDPVVEACLAGDEEAAVAVVADDPDGARAYAATKRALGRWVRRMAPTPEWAGAGIALNVVAPGLIDTPLAAYLLTDERREQSKEQVRMPLGGIGASPRNVASLLAWLTSAGNGLVTGQVVFVDGGHEVVTRGDDVW